MAQNTTIMGYFVGLGRNCVYEMVGACYSDHHSMGWWVLGVGRKLIVFGRKWLLRVDVGEASTSLQGPQGVGL